MTRLLRTTAQMVLISGQLVATLVYGVLSATFGWVVPSVLDFLLLVLFGVLSVAALACVNHALKLAPASVVAPYQYTMILSAIVLGYTVFGDVPDVFTLAGAAIIIAAGLYIFWLEQSQTQ
jgi:drug/metabolite transporter (DMT)-like permease